MAIELHFKMHCNAMPITLNNVLVGLFINKYLRYRIPFHIIKYDIM